MFEKKRHGGHHDACQVTNPDTIALISRLLMVRTHSHFSYLLNYISLNERLTICQVKETTLVDALTKKKAQAGGETINMPLTLANVSTIHHLPRMKHFDVHAERFTWLQAETTRDAIAKCLYSALFEWIVLQVNQALVSRHDFSEHKVS